tara:strand:+ start:612 stop:833 length:222 start_codon:yes stop_codon:yes gene_type:complete
VAPNSNKGIIMATLDRLKELKQELIAYTDASDKVLSMIDTFIDLEARLEAITLDARACLSYEIQESKEGESNE